MVTMALNTIGMWVYVPWFYNGKYWVIKQVVVNLLPLAITWFLAWKFHIVWIGWLVTWGLICLVPAVFIIFAIIVDSLND